MLTIVKTTGRTYIVEQITHALVYPDQTVVFPVDYHQVQLSGDDAQRMNEAMKTAGFVGEGTLINPARVSVIEDAGSTLKVFMDGADRPVFLDKSIEAALFPAQETQVSNPTPMVTAAPEKPRRAKKEAA